MRDNPLVSVIIPTFNRKTLVVRAIASVLNQTYPNLELLVVDDGSIDCTSAALSHFRSDPRFHYVYQQNKGQSAARNLAIELASGDLFAFLDSDNFWYKDKLNLQLTYWNVHKGFDILYSSVRCVDLSGNMINEHSQVINRPSGNILNALVSWNCVTNNTVLVPKKCFQEMGGFDETLRIAEDYDLWLRFATRYTFIYHPEIVTFYCTEGERLSTDEERNIEVNFHILEKFRNNFPGAVSNLRYRMAIGNLKRWKNESHWNGGIKPAFRDIISSLILNPFDARSWRHLVKYIIRKKLVTLN